MAFNRSRGRSGHLWQHRFYSFPLGAVHQGRALASVDLNPVRTKLVRQAGRQAARMAAA